jgi:hypothetical protein
VIYSYNKAKEIHYFSTLFDKEPCMFRTDLLSVIWSLNTVFITMGIFHTGYVDHLDILTYQADSQHNQCDKYLLL